MARGPEVCKKGSSLDVCFCGDCMAKNTFKRKPANEIPQKELLLRDVGILFEEVNKLRAENLHLKQEIGKYKKHIEESEKEEKEELAFYIKNQREAKGLSLREFALITKVSYGTIKNFEEGKGDIKSMREIVNRIQKTKGVKA